MGITETKKILIPWQVMCNLMKLMKKYGGNVTSVQKKIRRFSQQYSCSLLLVKKYGTSTVAGKTIYLDAIKRSLQLIRNMFLMVVQG